MPGFSFRCHRWGYISEPKWWHFNMLVVKEDVVLLRLKRVNNRFHGRQRLHLHFNKKWAERRHRPLTVRHRRSLSQALNQSSGAMNDNVPFFRLFPLRKKGLRTPNVIPERGQRGLPPSLPTAELSLWPGWGCSLQGSVLLNSGVAGARVTPAPALTSPHSHGPLGQGPSLSACPAAQSTHKPSLPVLFVSHHRPSTVRSHNVWLWWKGPPDTQQRQPGGFQIHYPSPWQSTEKKFYVLFI